MIGAVRGIDPETGFYYDDTKRYIEASTILSPDAKAAVYEGNARRVFSAAGCGVEGEGQIIPGRAVDHARRHLARDPNAA